MSAPSAFGSSSAVEIRSSRLIDSMSKRLAHMGAAGAQDLHHLVLILHRIEMRLHRLRLGHHFAQRQRGRKNLDENHVHREGGADDNRIRGTTDSETSSIAI